MSTRGVRAPQAFNEKENGRNMIVSGTGAGAQQKASKTLRTRTRDENDSMNQAEARRSTKRRALGKKSGIPVPKAGKTPLKSKTPASKLRIAEDAPTPASTSKTSELSQSIAEHRDFLENLRSIVNSRPSMKGIGKFAYKEKFERVVESYRLLRKTTGEYSQKARLFLERLPLLEEKLRSSFQQGMAEADQLRSVCESLEQEVTDSHGQLQKSKAETVTVRAQLKRVEAEHQNLSSSCAELQAQAETLNAKITELERSNTESNAQVQTLSSSLEAATAKAAALETDIAEKEAQHTRDLERMKLDLEERHGLKCENLNSKISDLTGSLEGVRAQLQRAETVIEDLKSQAATSSEVIAKLNSELNEQKQQLHEGAIAGARHEAEIGHLKESLQAKEREMERSLEGVKHSQIMSERRIEELTTEKKSLAQRVETMEVDRRAADTETSRLRGELDGANRELSSLRETQAEMTTRCASLDEKLSSTTQRFEEASTRASALEQQLAGVQSEVAAKQEELTTLTSTLNATKETLSDLQAESGTRIASLEASIKSAKAKASKLKEKLTSSTNECAELNTQLQALRDSAGANAQEQIEKLCKLSVENESLRKRLGVDQGVDLLAQAEERIRQLETRLFEGNQARKALHNMVQELRGNVRVAVRVRPLLGNEAESETSEHKAQGAIKCAASGSDLALVAGPGAGKRFSFDKVFGHSTTQAEIFEDVSELVQSALDGYNVCIFAYGQTGSGKTFTMQGGNTDETRGLIPRCIAQILETAQSMKMDGWDFTIKASFVEIYNEDVNDLLARAGSKSDLTIRQRGTGMEIDGLHQEVVSDFSQLDGILHTAARNRSVAATDMNQNSSRSHCCFILKMKGVNATRNTEVSGCLNLVDLAGSERLSRSGVTGARLKETQAINKSLSALVDVFDALAKKRQHIPFRNSKLTYLMQSCLSGHGKTMMIVNVSPTSQSGNETVCSLRFAKQVNQTELGRAKKQVRTHSDTGAASDSRRGASKRRAKDSGARHITKRTRK